ncbi:MAG: NADH-quinone oxidoreductase subunit A [Bacteroidota bacterium]
MNEISGFGVVLLFVVGAVGFLLTTLLVGKLLRPSKPNPEKQSTYESGEEAAGTAWGQFNVRFYIIALIFLLFEAELVFLFPWAIVFGKESLIEESNGLWATFSLIETFIFIIILIIGLVYVWAKGMLEWIKPTPIKSDYQSKIPESAYANFEGQMNG